jgi:putative hemolysin
MCWEIHNECSSKTRQMGVYKEKRNARDKYKGMNCVKTGNCAANGGTMEVKFSMHGIMMIITVYRESIRNVNTNTKL